MTAASVKIIVFWEVTPCCLTKTEKCFVALIMEAENTTETPIRFYQTTRNNTSVIFMTCLC